MEKYNIKFALSKNQSLNGITFKDIDSLSLEPISKNQILLTIGENKRILNYKNFDASNSKFLAYSKSNLQKRLVDCITFNKNLSFHQWKNWMVTSFTNNLKEKNND